MEKLAPRPSGGGARLGTLDMQSYLEVMGRQLAEIQAQHQQFYASRHDRLGRVRSQEQGHSGRRWSSDSTSAHKHTGGQTPSEDLPANNASMSIAEDAQNSTVGDGGSRVQSRFSGGGQGARRSLLFTDEQPAEVQSIAAGERSPEFVGPSVAMYTESLAVTGFSPTEQPASPSISPSSASYRPQPSSPATPCVSMPGGTIAVNTSQGDTPCTSDTSPIGPYAVYDLSGAASVSLVTQDTPDTGYPLTASPSSISQPQRPWRSGGLDECEEPSALEAAGVASPSTGSVISLMVAQTHVGPAQQLDDEQIMDEDAMPFTLALAGKAYDGIDSEEDDVIDAVSRIDPPDSQQRAEPGAGHAGQEGHRTGQVPHGMVHPPTLDLHVLESRPQSAAVPRAPLIFASLETEEALRVLLATPRFAVGASGAVSGSIDVDGFEIPEDVLAALAKVDGRDLDVALGAAMAVKLRDQGGAQETAGPHTVRPDVQALASSSNQAIATPPGRHPVLGPRALTATPASVHTAAAARGLDASMRATAQTISRNPGAGMGPCGFSSRGSLSGQQPNLCVDDSATEASFDVDGTDLLSRTLEISHEVGELLSEVHGGSALGTSHRTGSHQQPQPVLYSLGPRPTVAGSPAADSGRRDSSSRRLTVDGDSRRVTGESDSRRWTMDSGSRRNTLDGGGRRTTGEGLGLVDEPDSAQEALHSRFTIGQALAALLSSASPSLVRTGVVGCGPDSGSTNVSPSRLPHVLPSSPSAIRQGGDGDLVLYGSPNQKQDGTDGMATPSPGASPMAAPSPQTAPDSSPRILSPTVSFTGSRLQRNSRNLDRDISPGPTLGRQADGDSGASTPTAATNALRSWSATAGAHSNSRRRLGQPLPPGASTATSTQNVDYTQSLAQPVASTTGGCKQHCSTTSTPVLSPTSSARPPLLQGLSQPGPLQPSSGPGQPLSAHNSQKSVPFDAIAEEASSISPKAGTSSGALVPSRATSVDRMQPNHPHHAPEAPPLAAFSRAAALAAAADLGLPAPPSSIAKRRSKTMSVAEETVAQDARPSTSVGVVVERVQWGVGSGVGPSHEQGHALPALGNVEEHGVASRSGVTMAGAASDGGSHSLQEGRSNQEHSPGSGLLVSANAKLSQLKARRQQHWQSQYGLHGRASDVSAGGVSALGTPQSQHSQHNSIAVSPQQQRPATFGGDVGSQMSGASPSDRSNVTPRWPASSVRDQSCSNAPPGSSPGAPQPGSQATQLLPEAVAAAIARVASGNVASATGGEINLGHGISGLPTAIQAGQVKWAWQTDVKGNAGARVVDANATSPGGSCGTASPWASPIAAKAPAGESASDWALQHLPPPQWQRHGQLPAGARIQESIEQERHADTKVTNQVPPEQLQQGDQHSGARRHSEYSMLERPLVNTAASAAPHQYAFSAGGSMLQAQQYLRNASASDAGAHASNKAVALMRLKQQSILRHHVHVGAARESVGSSVQQSEQQQITPAPQSQHPARASSAAAQRQQPPHLPPRSSSAISLHQQQRQAAAARMPECIPEHAEQELPPSRGWVMESEGGEAGGYDEESQAQPKPFLRRRSAKVQARKVDWSHVKPRTNSRNPDYYVEPSGPEVLRKVNPQSPPKGGAVKPPLNANGGARAKKAHAKTSQASPEEDIAPGPVIAGARRRISNIPSGPAPVDLSPAVLEKRGPSLGGAARGKGGISPLDDLLAHVNTLLRDFDKVVT